MPNSNFTSRIILIACAIFILVMLIIQFNKKSSFVSTKSEESSSKEKYENMIQNATEEEETTDKQIMDKPLFDQEFFNQPIITQEQNKIMNIGNTGNTGNIESMKNIASNILASEPKSNEDYKAIDYETTKDAPTECYPKDKLTAEDLLPRDAANSKWAEVNPAGQGDVADRNFLSAGYHIGVDTIGQSLRNPNYQLRSDPPNPKMNVGPWNQTTIEYDQGRKHFEINEC